MFDNLMSSQPSVGWAPYGLCSLQEPCTNTQRSMESHDGIAITAEQTTLVSLTTLQCGRLQSPGLKSERSSSTQGACGHNCLWKCWATKQHPIVLCRCILCIHDCVFGRAAMFGVLHSQAPFRHYSRSITGITIQVAQVVFTFHTCSYVLQHRHLAPFHKSK